MTHSYDSVCPNCEGSMNSSNSNRPFETVAHECLNCGFYAYTEYKQADLEEVNEWRADNELEPLTELPELKII